MRGFAFYPLRRLWERRPCESIVAQNRISMPLRYIKNIIEKRERLADNGGLPNHRAIV